MSYSRESRCRRIPNPPPLRLIPSLWMEGESGLEIEAVVGQKKAEKIHLGALKKGKEGVGLKVGWATGVGSWEMCSWLYTTLAYSRVKHAKRGRASLALFIRGIFARNISLWSKVFFRICLSFSAKSNNCKYMFLEGKSDTSPFSPLPTGLYLFLPRVYGWGDSQRNIKRGRKRAMCIINLDNCPSENWPIAYYHICRKKCFLFLVTRGGNLG